MDVFRSNKRSVEGINCCAFHVLENNNRHAMKRHD